MASPPVLDFAKLLAPISAEKPTGEDPRVDPSPVTPYQSMRTAREKAKALERRPTTEAPDWKTVKQLGEKVLMEKAKDLEVAAWLIEALLRQDKFPGLRDGFMLAREFVERYWDNLYPVPGEDIVEEGEIVEHGLATRVAHMCGLDESLTDGPITRVALTKESSAGPAFTLANYYEAMSLKGNTNAADVKKRVDAGAVSEAKLLQGVKETPAVFYQNLVEDLEACYAEFGKFDDSLTKKCNGRGPTLPTSKLKTALTGFMDTVKELSGDKWKPAPAAPSPGPAQPVAAGAAVPAPAAPEPFGVIRTREQALELLGKVKDFFRDSEPHSPISYQLEQVERWAEMTFPELVKELIAEDAQRKNVLKLINIKMP